MKAIGGATIRASKIGGAKTRPASLRLFLRLRPILLPVLCLVPAIFLCHRRAGAEDAPPAQAKQAEADAAGFAPGKPIPKTYFGLTTKDFAHVEPLPGYGTARSWDGVGLSWSEINPRPGVYDFAAFDEFVKRNEARGAEMIYTFGRTPQWASSQPARATPYGPGECAPPADLNEWDRFVGAVVHQAAGRILYYELWNEPNDTDFYCGDGEAMVRLAQHAYRIIHAMQPQATVLSPAPAGDSGAGWFSAYLADGGAQSFDALAFHGYWNTRAEEIGQVIARYRGLLMQAGAWPRPIWDTEGSWGCCGDTLNEAQQAAFLAKYFLLQWSEGVARFVWYAYDGGKWGGLWSAAGGLNASGAAFREVEAWMAGAAMPQPCAADARGTWSCKLDRGEGKQAIAVWNSTHTENFPAAAEYTHYRDLSGRVFPVMKGQVPVGNAPVLIETGTATVAP